MKISSKVLHGTVSLVSVVLVVKALAEPLLALDKNRIIATLHAEGAQIYECKPDTSMPASQVQALTWQFREPIATLMVDGQSIGRHYSGPSWDHIDGSGVKGRVVASMPAATTSDIPWLEIEVVDRRNKGILFDAATVLRINTKGGMARGPCEGAGAYLSIPYAADYLFLRRSD
ncbi:DUF3455 domain-containing protein [Bradyrhizobium sp. BEA-2-5]|uniref:DUF3455 domain-containing protein n=1 Tax=Bradyrhizobium TaxID=374 RepID=UPI00067AA04D|nr:MULTISPECIES: DUF3455 domain-containing protein [Bradyrhizobium]WOH80923.1 DUF3455 domain-containing protein [Bradyrhizobium sp. BEA-2-5]